MRQKSLHKPQNVFTPKPLNPSPIGEAACEGAPPPAGGSAETTSAGRNLLPRNPLTTNR